MSDWSPEAVRRERIRLMVEMDNVTRGDAAAMLHEVARQVERGRSDFSIYGAGGYPVGWCLVGESTQKEDSKTLGEQT